MLNFVRLRPPRLQRQLLDFPRLSRHVATAAATTRMQNSNGTSVAAARKREPLLGAIDQGTSSSRFILFQANSGAVVASHQQEFASVYPEAGWCEQDPRVLLQSVEACIEGTVSKLPALGYSVGDIQAVGIANQRETTVAWDRRTGEPLGNALVWLDTRTSGIVNQMVAKLGKDAFRAQCGLPLATYFSALKMRWMLDHREQVAAADRDKSLQFGTVDSWLLYNLLGKSVHITDVTNASRTMLMDLATCQWSDSLCGAFGISKLSLPEIRSSSEVYGRFATGPLKGIPIAGCLGDQQAALVGQQCWNKGEAKNTYGTGCFMLFNTGESPIISNAGLLSTVAFQLGPQEPVHYALEGSIAIAGAAIKWLRDNLGMIQNSSDIGPLAAKVSNTGGVYFVPAFSGLFAPYWRDDARGTIVGLTQYANKSHIARATLEAVSYQTREIFEAIQSDCGVPLKGLKVDGGMTNSDVFMQIQSDILQSVVHRPVMRETTALGAALAAGIGCGFWKSCQEISMAAQVETFHPTPNAPDHFAIWKKAVERSFGWATVLEENQKE